MKQAPIVFDRPKRREAALSHLHLVRQKAPPENLSGGAGRESD